MPITKLNIEFGGLCLLVKSTKPGAEGLFVLMPAMRHGPEPHCPVVVCSDDYSADNKVTLKHLTEGPAAQPVVDLRDLRGPGTTKPLKGAYARMSRYATHHPNSPYPDAWPVDDGWLTGPPDGHRLAARIVLPVNSVELTEPGKKASLKVPGEAQPVSLVGRAKFRIDVPAQLEKEKLEIAGGTFVHVGGTMEIAFLNVPPTDLAEFQEYGHEEGAAVTHIQGYYALLKSWKDHEEGPPVRIAKKVPGKPRVPSPMKCADVELKEWPPTTFVDPYNCTIGIGCADGSDEC